MEMQSFMIKQKDFFVKVKLLYKTYLVSTNDTTNILNTFCYKNTGDLHKKHLVEHNHHFTHSTHPNQ